MFRILTFHYHPVQYHCFHLLRQVLTNQRCHMADSLSPAAVQFTLSSNKLHLHYADCSVLQQRGSPSNILCILCLHKVSVAFSKLTLTIFMLSDAYLWNWCVTRCWNQTCFKLKMDSEVHDGHTGPSYHEQQQCAVLAMSGSWLLT